MNKYIPVIFLASICAFGQNAHSLTAHRYASVEIVSKPGGIKPVKQIAPQGINQIVISRAGPQNTNSVQLLNKGYAVFRGGNHVQISKFLAQYE